MLLSRCGACLVGRVTFAQNRGSASLLALSGVGDRNLDAVVAHVLTALARDNRPRTDGLPLGVVLIAESGQDVVQALLRKLMGDLQQGLEAKLRHAALGGRGGGRHAATGASEGGGALALTPAPHPLAVRSMMGHPMLFPKCRRHPWHT